MLTQYPQSVPVYKPYPENFENLKLKEEDDAYDDGDYESGDDDSELKASRRRERSNQIVNEFLQQVAENRFFEFSWPPDSDCPAYKYGYIREKNLKFVEKSKRATEFVDQLRRSWGYDIDCAPPRWMSHLNQIDFQSEGYHYGRMMSAAKLVIDRINTQAEKMQGKRFELVQVNKGVVGGYCLYLLTLTIKEVGAGSEMYVRATVTTPIGHDPQVEECKLVSSLST